MVEGMIPSESRMQETRMSGLMSGGEETQVMTETEAPARGESRRTTATRPLTTLLELSEAISPDGSPLPNSSGFGARRLGSA